ncbi:MAG: DUF4831 family protein [Bacteroidales bacterium]|nr:DUF4831 family protein [Bacteroidales bacterium]
MKKSRQISVIFFWVSFFSIVPSNFADAQIQSVSIIDKAIVKNTDRFTLYALPRTVLKIRCYVSQKIQMAGPYAQYARELIGKEAIVRDASWWEIDSIEIIPTLIIDPSQVYVVKYGKKIDLSALEDLSRMGLIVFPLTQSYSSILPDSTHLSSTAVNEWPVPFFPLSSTSSDTTYRIVVKDSLVIRQPVVKTKSTSLSMYDRAKEVAKLIQQLHQRRLDLVLSEDDPIPTNEKALQWIVNELQRKEEEYLQLFLGRTVSQSMVYTFYHVPMPKDQQTEIFRFSQQRGFSTKSDQSAAPVYFSIESDNTLNILRDYQPLFTTLTSAYIFYRVPETASVVITWKGKIITRVRLPLHQLGALVPWLPAEK